MRTAPSSAPATRSGMLTLRADQLADRQPQQRAEHDADDHEDDGEHQPGLRRRQFELRGDSGDRWGVAATAIGAAAR